MLTPYYARLQTSQVDGAAFTATAIGTILPAQAKFTLPANFLQFIGQDLRIRAAGRASTTTGTNTLTFSIVFGSIVVFASGAVTLIASQTNQSWCFDATLTLRAVGGGTTANFMGIGNLYASAAILTNGKDRKSVV